MTKQEQVVKIVAENAGKTRKEVIAIIREKLEMTDAGASTYYYNATKKVAATVKTTEALAEIAKQDSTPEVVAAKVKSNWSDDWQVRNSAARATVDAFIASLDLSAIPAFLKN